MPFTEFPIATTTAQPDAFHTTFASPAALLAGSDAARGTGAHWRVRGPGQDHLYEEVASGEDVTTAGAIPLKVLAAQGNWLYVDAFGAVGDGVTDDTAAIQTALDAVPEAGVIVFSAGKTYLVSAQITSRGRSMTILAHGATFKCDDLSVWHVFNIGGDDENAIVDHVRWYGGTFDGNLENQNYYPNNNGTITYTDLGIETFGAEVGTPFYANGASANTGAEWVTNGTTYVNDANGGGNKGLLLINYARQAVFEDITCTNYVRNGLVTWVVAEVHANRCRSIGQLPTTYFELNGLFGGGLAHEASFMKFTGTEPVPADNTIGAILNGYYCERVFVSNCAFDGGAMPLFVRTNAPKSPAIGTSAIMTACQFYGCARECWFELVSSVRITDSDITCADYPNSTERKTPAVFIGGGTEDCIIQGCFIFGRINTNTMQAARRIALVNSTLIDWAGRQARPFQGTDIIDSYVESRSGGVLANRIQGSQIYCEDTASTDSLKVQESITNSVVGRERYEGTRERVIIPEGISVAASSELTLSGSPDVVQRVYARGHYFHGGRWFEIHSSQYEIVGSLMTLKTGSTVFYAFAGDIEVEVDWYANKSSTLPTSGALETTYTLDATGGNRTQDILTIAYGAPGSEASVPHRSAVATPASDFHWTHAMNSSGVMVITLVNGGGTITDGHQLVVTYRPPLAPYREMVLGPTGANVDITGRNFQGIRTEGGHNRIQGTYTDIGRQGLMLWNTGTQSVDISDLRLNRCAGGVVCGTNVNAEVNRLSVTNSQFRDVMLHGTRLLTGLGSIQAISHFGFNRSSGSRILREFLCTSSYFIRSGDESGATQVIGGGQAALLVNGYSAEGSNWYLGTTPSVAAGVGAGSAAHTLPDGAV